VNVENGSWGNIRCSYSTVSGIGSHFSSVRICVYFKTASHLVLSYPCPDMKTCCVTNTSILKLRRHYCPRSPLNSTLHLEKVKVKETSSAIVKSPGQWWAFRSKKQFLLLKPSFHFILWG